MFFVVTNKVTDKAALHSLHSRVYLGRPAHIYSRTKQGKTVDYHQDFNGAICHTARCFPDLATLCGWTRHANVETGFPKYCPRYSPWIVQAPLPPTGSLHKGI